MFIPIYDSNRIERIQRQYVTLSLIGINALMFLLGLAAGPGFEQATTIGLGYIPVVAMGSESLPPELHLVPAALTWVSYAFVHANLAHLAGNMLFLWVFGDNVEDALGHARFLLFYLACAVAGAWAHGLIEGGDSYGVLIGASGAVAGVTAAYLVLHPKVRIWVLALKKVPLPLPAWVVLGSWVGWQFLMLAAGADGGVSWAAHVGGILAGVALVVVLRRPGVALFDREIQCPRAVELARGRD